MGFNFPSDFPSKEEMYEIIHKTNEKSWNRTYMDSSCIDDWLENFTGKVYDIEVEKRLMLWLLCNFTYYSEKDTNYLCSFLFKKFIHSFASKNNIDPFDLEKELLNVYFLPGGSASESGGLLLYHFRQESKLSMDRFSYIISTDKFDTLVFVDDVTISGGSAIKFFNNELLSTPHKDLYYLTIIASEDAVEKLEEKGIFTIYCYLLDERNKCFSDQSVIFNKFPELLAPTREIALKYGEGIINSPDKPLGYDNGEYCFGFFYNTPNNTLPIFWSNKNWNPIFERKGKVYYDKQYKFPKYPFI